MKKTVTIVLALMSASAFASKARLEALGEDKNGSFYVNDNRSMFLNPAHVNYHKDFLTYEWGATRTATETQTGPRSEGGFFRTMGAMNYGLYLGNQSDRILAKRNTAGTGSTAFNTQSNPVDLFVGGEASAMKWGANLTYSNSENNNAGSFKQTEDYIGLKAGVEMNNLEVFAQTDLVNKAKGADQVNDEFKGKMGAQVGATYMLNDLKVYATYGRYNSSFKNENAAGTTITESKYSDSNYKIGVGRVATVNDKTKVFTRIEYIGTNSSVEQPDSKHYSSTQLVYGNSLTGNVWSLPVAVGIEHDALSWLTLRGSVSQSLTSSLKSDTTYSKRVNDTSVNMGATLALGSVKLDGLVGTTDTNNTAGTQNGVLSTNNLMTRVALRYNF